MNAITERLLAGLLGLTVSVSAIPASHSLGKAAENADQSQTEQVETQREEAESELEVEEDNGDEAEAEETEEAAEPEDEEASEDPEEETEPEEAEPEDEAEAEEKNEAEEEEAEPETHEYRINRVKVRYDSSEITNNCYAYARELYEMIWGERFENGREKDDNYLKNIVSVPALELTEEHLREYVSAAAPGSVLRTSDRAYLFAYADETGHSQLIVDVDEDGFTVLESNMWLNPGVGPREHYYTWSEYVETWYNANHRYIKYIKNPKAEPLPCIHQLTEGSAAWITRCEDGERLTDCALCGESFDHAMEEDGLGFWIARRWLSLCDAPYVQAASGEYLAAGSMILVNATAVNAYGEPWYRCRAGWLRAEDLEPVGPLGTSTRSERE